MYRAVVAVKVRRAWRELQRRNPSSVLDQFADDFEHSFAGEHALGGKRRTRRTQAEWFDRLFRLFPDIRFTVRDVLVAGWPWHTRVVTVVDVALADEPGYHNVVMQQLELRWGRITRIANLEDTQALAAILTRRGAQGQAEAIAPRIGDGPRGQSPTGIPPVSRPSED